MITVFWHNKGLLYPRRTSDAGHAELGAASARDGLAAAARAGQTHSILGNPLGDEGLAALVVPPPAYIYTV